MHIGDLFENRGIELVSMSNDTVTFRSAQKFHPGGRVSFELDGQTVKLLVEEVSPDGDGNLFSGRAVVGKEILEGHFPQMHSHQQKRRAPRVLHRMKIVSEKLPSFQALSLDFSPLGLRIRLDGAIEENQTIPRLGLYGVVATRGNTWLAWSLSMLMSSPRSSWRPSIRKWFREKWAKWRRPWLISIGSTPPPRKSTRRPRRRPPVRGSTFAAIWKAIPFRATASG